MNAIRLKTEYLKHPIGMDIVKPQLFWNCAEGGAADRVPDCLPGRTRKLVVGFRQGGKLLHAGSLCGCADSVGHLRRLR